MECNVRILLEYCWYMDNKYTLIKIIVNRGNFGIHKVLETIITNHCRNYYYCGRLYMFLKNFASFINIFAFTSSRIHNKLF